MSIAFSKWFKKGAKLAATLMLGAALTLSSMPSAFALNRDGISGVQSGHKPFGFTGYRYVDSTHLEINVDKTIGIPPTGNGAKGDINAGMFTVKNHSTGTAVTVSSVTWDDSDHDGYSGCSDHGLDKGAKITLTLGSALAADTAYDVSIAPFLFANQSLTNFENRGGSPTLDDPNQYILTFTLRTPQSGGTYSNTTPYVTFLVGGKPMSATNDNRTGVSYESNLTVVFDRPFANNATTLSTFYTNLSNNYKKSGVKVLQAVGNEVGRDINNVVSPSLSEYVTYECHYPVSNNVNNVNNTFYFPMTNYIAWWWNNGDQTLKQYSFNRTNPGSNSYSLTLPTYTDVNGNTFSTFINARSGQTLTTSSQFIFTTVTQDLPGHGVLLTSVTAPTSGGLTVSWDPSKIDPLPSGTQVWVCPSSEGVYGTYYTDSAWKTMNSSTGTITIHGNATHPLNVGTSYYVRIVPYSGGGLVGFSLPWRNTTDPYAPIAVAPVAP